MMRRVPPSNPPPPQQQQPTYINTSMPPQGHPGTPQHVQHIPLGANGAPNAFMIHGHQGPPVRQQVPGQSSPYVVYSRMNPDLMKHGGRIDGPPYVSGPIPPEFQGFHQPGTPGPFPPSGMPSQSSPRFVHSSTPMMQSQGVQQHFFPTQSQPSPVNSGPPNTSAPPTHIPTGMNRHPGMGHPLGPGAPSFPHPSNSNGHPIMMPPGSTPHGMHTPQPLQSNPMVQTQSNHQNGPVTNAPRASVGFSHSVPGSNPNNNGSQTYANSTSSIMTVAPSMLPQTTDGKPVADDQKLHFVYSLVYDALIKNGFLVTAKHFVDEFQKINPKSDLPWKRECLSFQYEIPKEGGMGVKITLVPTVAGDKKEVSKGIGPRPGTSNGDPASAPANKDTGTSNGSDPSNLFSGGRSSNTPTSIHSTPQHGNSPLEFTLPAPNIPLNSPLPRIAFGSPAGYLMDWVSFFSQMTYPVTVDKFNGQDHMDGMNRTTTINRVSRNGPLPPRQAGPPQQTPDFNRTYARQEALNGNTAAFADPSVAQRIFQQPPQQPPQTQRPPQVGPGYIPNTATSQRMNGRPDQVAPSGMNLPGMPPPGPPGNRGPPFYPPHGHPGHPGHPNHPGHPVPQQQINARQMAPLPRNGTRESVMTPGGMKPEQHGSPVTPMHMQPQMMGSRLPPGYSHGPPQEQQFPKYWNHVKDLKEGQAPGTQGPPPRGLPGHFSAQGGPPMPGMPGMPAMTPGMTPSMTPAMPPAMTPAMPPSMAQSNMRQTPVSLVPQGGRPVVGSMGPPPPPAQHQTKSSPNQAPPDPSPKPQGSSNSKKRAAPSTEDNSPKKKQKRDEQTPSSSLPPAPMSASMHPAPLPSMPSGSVPPPTSTPLIPQVSASNPPTSLSSMMSMMGSNMLDIASSDMFEHPTSHMGAEDFGIGAISNELGMGPGMDYNNDMGEFDTSFMESSMSIEDLLAQFPMGAADQPELDLLT